MDLPELGAFVTSRRHRIRPSDVGLPTGPRRRVPGLRRDEVAQLAGASVEYYIEIERGSGTQPSEQMLAALARALRLSHDERAHLFHLAGRALPAEGGASAHLHPGLLDLMARLDGTPAQVITDLHVTLVQNPMAVALVGDQTRYRGETASVLHRWFLEPDGRALYPPADHERLGRSFVADLRAAVARRGPQDAESSALVARLLARSPEFAELWERHDVAVRRDDRKRLVHAELGVVEVNCLNLHSEDGSQRLLWFTPAVGTDAVERLELLRVLGTQDLEPARAD